MGCGCGGGSTTSTTAPPTKSADERVYVNYYPDRSTEETTGEANAQARARARGGTYRLKG